MLLGFVSGCRKSDVHPTAALRVGAAAPDAGFPTMATAVAETVDMRQWAAPVHYQIGSQCVGQSVRSANAMAARGQGKVVSARGVYVAARVREIARKGDAIPDTGCQPLDAYDAIVNGVALYPEDARDFDPNALNARDTWDEEVQCKALPVEAFAPLDDGDTTSLDLWLSSQCPATFTINVDAAYFALSAASPIWTPGGASSGLHRQALAGRANIAVANGRASITPSGVPCYIVENSWGTGWGDGGYSYIPVATFAQQATEVVVHRAWVVL